jgi:class 3 adenylate cyclase/CHASE2 domain-containing sensor protein
MRPDGAIAVAVGLILVGAALAAVPALRNLDLALLDLKFALLATHAPLAAPDSIAVVGIDEPSLDALAEPQSLLLRPLASALAAIVAAKPRAIGLDIVLPDRSYDAFAPGSDMAMVSALLAARKDVPIIAGITTRDDGSVREIAPALRAAAGGTGLALLPVDRDGRVRRFDERLGVEDRPVPTLVGELARVLGLPVENGLIQYALGSGYDYVPLRQVLEWNANGDRSALERAFGGRIVLIGGVLPYEDRFAQPVRLARWDPVRDVPGVLVHAQVLRSLEAGAIVRTAGAAWQALLLTLAASLWFVPGWYRRVGALAAFALLSFAMSTLLLRYGTDLPLGASLRVALIAVALKSALEAWQVRQDRARLRAQFGGYVSPAVLDAILGGRLDDDARRGRRTLAFLFVDVRRFVELTSSHTPEDVLDLLNRYFGAMTPVLHSHGGTIDNFRGDGLMAIFGAPNTMTNPAAAATASARDMLAALPDLNRELVTAGHPPIAIGVSMAFGEAVVGNVGSRERFNYTALGDGANVASRLQDVAKSTGYPVVATSTLIEAAGETGQWTPLGGFAIRGHNDVQVCGWPPAA